MTNPSPLLRAARHLLTVANDADFNGHTVVIYITGLPPLTIQEQLVSFQSHTLVRISGSAPNRHNATWIAPLEALVGLEIKTDWKVGDDQSVVGQPEGSAPPASL